MAPIRRAAGARSPVRSVTCSPRPRSRRDRRTRLRQAACRRATARRAPARPSRHRPANGRSPPATARAPRAPAEAASRGRASSAALPAATGSPPASPRMPRPGTARTSPVGDRLEAALRRPRRRSPRASAMLGMALQPGRAGEHLVARRPVGLDADEARPARRERAGLVEGDARARAPGPRARPGRGRGSRGAPAARCRARSPAARRGRPRRDRRRPAPRGRPAAPRRTAAMRPDRATVSAAEDEHERHGHADDAVGDALHRAAAGERLAHRAADLRPAGRGPGARCCGSAAARRG